MKTKFAVLTVLFLSLLIIGVAAQWSAMSSGYAITTNWHGEEVPIGESVTAWAGTNDSTVKKVEFEWKDPDENLIFNENVTIFGPYTTPNVPSGAPQEIVDWADKYPGRTIYYATNTQAPDVIGDWGVKAIFHDSGTIQGQDSTIVAMRATSFDVIPEIPIVGTAGATIAMLLGLGLFYRKKKQS